MRDLILRDDRELRRIESAISMFEQRSASDRLRRHCLLAALTAERDELLRVLGRSRVPSRRAVATNRSHTAA
jgi:hypothetical protein